MAGWVSVEDKLPEGRSDYQVYCADTGEQFVAFHYGEGKFQFGRYKDSVTDVLLLCRPTHWTQLPEPPKQ